MNFIYTKPQVLSKEVCEKFIENFETSPLINKGYTYSNGKIAVIPEIKSSSDINFNSNFIYHPVWGDLLKRLISNIEEEVHEYVLKFSEGLYNISEFKLDPIFNIQRYHPGEGYHKFHCERGADSKNLKRSVICFVTNGSPPRYLITFNFDRSTWPNNFSILRLLWCNSNNSLL